MKIDLEDVKDIIEECQKRADKAEKDGDYNKKIWNRGGVVALQRLIGRTIMKNRMKNGD